MDINYEKTSSVYAETLPTGRTYFTPDGDFPSITTLLGKTSDNQVWLQKWRERVGEEEANRISKEATDRGTLIHEYAEKYFNVLPKKPVNKYKGIKKEKIPNKFSICVLLIFCRKQ